MNISFAPLSSDSPGSRAGWGFLGVNISFAPLSSDSLPPASEKKILLITFLAFVVALFLGAATVMVVEENRLRVQQKAASDLAFHAAKNIYNNLTRQKFRTAGDGNAPSLWWHRQSSARSWRFIRPPSGLRIWPAQMLAYSQSSMFVQG